MKLTHIHSFQTKSMPNQKMETLDPKLPFIEFQLKDLRKKISTIEGYSILISILKRMLYNEYPTATVRKYHEEIVHCYEKLIKVTKCHNGYFALQSLMCCLYGSTYEDHLSKDEKLISTLI